jgi:dye decolorizing peroxidase
MAKDDGRTARTDGPSRRGLLAASATAGVAGLALGAGGGVAGTALASGGAAPLSSLGSGRLPFRGAHQAGIAFRAQAHACLVAFDLAAARSKGRARSGAAALMRRWSAAAEAMMAGRAPDPDDQIALGSGPASLSVVFGFGPGVFARAGLESVRPAALEPPPPFVGDALVPEHGGGDLYVEVAADDQLVVAHAVRVLQRIADGAATVRWLMNGFSRSPGAAGAGSGTRTPRNLMGQLDGTGNPRPGTSGFDRHVYVPDGGVAGRSPAWMSGGSYAVVRRIRMLLDDWERLPVARQEKVVGRRRSDGAPLSGGHEYTPLDLDEQNPDGSLAIAGDAHVRVATPEGNQGATILRRVFSYFDGYRSDGAPDAGLLFVAWQADPESGFVPIQQKLAQGDGLSRFLRHESSAVFAVPGGPGRGSYVGQALLEG